MDWQEFIEKHEEKSVIVNIKPDVHKKLIQRGIPIGDPKLAFLDDLLVVVNRNIRAESFRSSEILKNKVNKIIEELSNK